MIREGGEMKERGRTETQARFFFAAAFSDLLWDGKKCPSGGGGNICPAVREESNESSARERERLWSFGRFASFPSLCTQIPLGSLSLCSRPGGYS
jgi:hypothetical protein